jgi:N-acetylglutamate synthase-like GNAT family acetyltransferase
MRLDEYVPADEQACLAIFDSNTPAFFAVKERETFQRFLRGLAAPYAYFVVRDEQETIVACGGTKLEPANGLAKLRWDMVAGDLHGRKIGSFLTGARLELIRRSREIRTVRLGTSQYSYLFYEKMGFVTLHITPDGIVPGMDEYVMELTLGETKRIQ